mmetsp:Transcript_13958/g.20280  ORF Transcript_13958/g.20280 Transcript_13958/m.20280 type:complete len:429 (+) Transcript_13958:132-1418(+)
MEIGFACTGAPLRRPRVARCTKMAITSGGENRNRSFFAGAAGALAASVVIWSGAVTNTTSFALTDEQKLIAEAWRVVDQGYIDRTFNNQDWFKIRMKAVKKQYKDRQEAYQAIRKIVSSLDDPYTRFLSPDQLESLTSTTTGDIAGIGLELYPGGTKAGLQVLNVEEEGPAFRNGLKPDDVIIEIDGEETTELTPDEGAARIRGSPGTTVVLTVQRTTDKQEELNLKIVREQLKLKSVTQSVKISPENRKVGYVKIKSFNGSTADDVKAALENLKKQGAQEYVVDLRNNPGGYFPAGVEVAQLFLDEGSTVAFVINSKGIQDEYMSSMPAVTRDPVAVLINKNTASASEVLAGALKDNNRAVLIGEKSFGKGVVQTVSPLSDGSGLAVTIAKYETPNHKEVNKVGIFPDISKTCPQDETFVQCLPDGF